MNFEFRLQKYEIIIIWFGMHDSLNLMEAEKKNVNSILQKSSSKTTFQVLVKSVSNSIE